MTLRQKNNPPTGKVRTHRDPRRRNRWRAKSRAWSFSLTSMGCTQRIRPGRPKSQFRILLWRFTASAWKCGYRIPGCCIATTHHLTLPFTPGNFWPRTKWCRPPLTLLSWLGPLRLSLFLRKIKLEGRHFTQLVWSRQNHSQYLPSRNTTFRMRLKSGRSTRTVHTHGRELFRGLEGPKLLSDRMAAPVPEIMDTTSRALIHVCVCARVRACVCVYVHGQI
jgi:hypothetical protein